MTQNNLNSKNSNFITLCKPELNSFCKQELENYQTAYSITNINKEGDNITFSLSGKNQQENLLKIFQKISTVYSLSKLIWQGHQVQDLNSSKDQIISDLITDINDLSIESKKQYHFRVLCEGISGNENRINYSSIAQKILIELFKKQGIELIIDYKNPEFVLSLSQNSSLSKDKNKFSLGLKLHSKDLDKRDWRVYTHKASFRGDFSSSICNLAEINKSKSLLFLFCRDGALAIESACDINNFPIRPLSKILKQYQKNNHISNQELVLTSSKDSSITDTKIICIDDSNSNIRASINNAKMAGINDKIKFHCSPLDEINLILGSESIDTAIIHMTGKDERRINEIFNQLSQTLKPNANILFISRSGFEIEGDSSFSLKWKKLIPRGSGFIPITCLTKN